MVGDVVGMALIAVLCVLVVASLAVLPANAEAAPRRPQFVPPKRRPSEAWLSVSAAFKALSLSRS